MISARPPTDSLTTGQWLVGAMQGSWDVATALLDVAELADLLGDRHRIIANDWQAADMSALAGRLLMRANDVLDRVDFSPAALRADLGASRTAPRLLYSAGELVAHAADLLSDSAGLVHDNERRWRTFRARVVELVDDEHATGDGRLRVSRCSGVGGDRCQRSRGRCGRRTDESAANSARNATRESASVVAVRHSYVSRLACSP